MVKVHGRLTEITMRAYIMMTRVEEVVFSMALSKSLNAIRWVHLFVPKRLGFES